MKNIAAVNAFNKTLADELARFERDMHQHEVLQHWSELLP